MSESNGGSAFPNITPDMNIQGGPGMTLRDYFAAKAMQGLCSKKNVQEDFKDLDVKLLVKQIALDSYLMADAMLKARGEV